MSLITLTIIGSYFKKRMLLLHLPNWPIVMDIKKRTTTLFTLVLRAFLANHDRICYTSLCAVPFEIKGLNGILKLLHSQIRAAPH